MPPVDYPTDTWVAPQFAGRPALEPALDDVVRAHEEELGSLRSNLASVTQSRGQLEVSLSGLTTNLRELEQRLHAKSEQLSRYEREVGARDRRIGELEKDLAARVEQLSVDGGERDALQLRLERAIIELGQLTQLRERQAAVQNEVERDRARREAVFARTQADLLEAQRRLDQHGEALQHAEGRRQIFDAMLLEREQLLDGRDAALLTSESARALLAAELQGAQARAVESQRLLTQAHAEHSQQAERAQQSLVELETQLTSHRQQLQIVEQRHQGLLASGTEAAARSVELDRQLQEAQQQRLVADSARQQSESRLAGLESEVSDHGEAVRTIHEQLRLAQLGNETLRGDLAAAEDLIRTSESELQQREARLARLESNELALRSKLEAVGRSLDERNALIARLEGEAASSAAVLGSIQTNLERLDRESVASTSTPVGEPTQILVRTDGEADIVHVLGRRTTIGRTPDNDLRIEADFISRHHAVILTTSSGTIVEDLDSTNGVFVNGVRVTRRHLNGGDLVIIGKTGFRFIVKPATP